MESGDSGLMMKRKKKKSLEAGNASGRRLMLELMKLILVV